MKIYNFKLLNSKSIGGNDISEKMLCCGCSACAQKCPKQCIQMHEDAEGFLYPEIDENCCIDCGLCYMVCPVQNSNFSRKPIAFYATQSKDNDLRLQSSSGGIFSLLAENCIQNGGVVFGAKFDNEMELVHSYTDNIDGLSPLRGSKYIQSKIGNSFKQVEFFLKQGRQVLFSGVPCQIAALNRYLNKEYKTLLTVDIICHGVPSPGVFREYLKFLGKNQKVIALNFRDKCSGWTGYSTSYVLSNGKRKHFRSCLDYFMGGGIKLHYYLRPSCFNCPAKDGKSISDITLGDLWHISIIPEIYDDDKGASLVAVHSIKGEFALSLIDVEKLVPQCEELVSKHNASFYISSEMPKDRDVFWKQYSLLGFSVVKQFCNNRLRPTRLHNKLIICKGVIKKYLKL